MKSMSKKLARPTIRTPKEDTDPVGFARALAEVLGKLEEAYHARLRAFLLKFLLVRLEAAARRRILEAGTAQGGPVSFDLRITVHPRDASGFPRVVGKLGTTSAELSDEDQPDQQPGAPEDGPYIETLFGKRVPVSRLKTKRRRFGRRR
jgi:hypothetical protein